jgi:hypothetical protein
MSRPADLLSRDSVSLGIDPDSELAHRRARVLEQAQRLRESEVANATSRGLEFIAFFDDVVDALFRDEEEWMSPLVGDHPPATVIDALHDHLEISALVSALANGIYAGCADLRILHRIGESLERHLLLESQELFPLLKGDECD